MSRRPLTAAVAAIAVTLVLSACGGDPEPSAPSAPPTTAQGASPSAAPSEAPSTEDEALYVALGRLPRRRLPARRLRAARLGLPGAGDEPAGR